MARLRHHDECGADAELISNMNRVVSQPFNRQVLSKHRPGSSVRSVSEKTLMQSKAAFSPTCIHHSQNMYRIPCDRLAP
jgi:hypothetical protein